MNKEEILEKYPFLTDYKWRAELHKHWFWGKDGEELLVWDNGELSYIACNEWFQEEPEDLLAVIKCPGHNNMDTWDYEDKVGVKQGDEWTWHPEYPVPEGYPAKPTWEDIINFSIENGDWDDWEEKLVNEIVEQVQKREKLKEKDVLGFSL